MMIKKMMIKKMMMMLTAVSGFASNAHAQIDIAAIIRAGVDRVIKAADLKIQREQTETIWLQNAEKELENEMTRLKLDQITSWVEAQEELYQEYYDELWQVKEIIADYHKATGIIRLQEKIWSEYQAAYASFKQDKNFTPAEISYMGDVYAGILNESIKNVDQLLLATTAMVTQMTDGERLDIISDASRNMQKNYDDLKRFTSEQVQLSLQRAQEHNDIGTVKKLYGLE
ncbi:MAG TPA: hypothetical protein VKR53_12855 [Puia sp.]|nr:hypothetical protein [Puia sp.]